MAFINDERTPSEEKLHAAEHAAYAASEERGVCQYDAAVAGGNIN